MNYKVILKMIGFLEAERETPPQGRRRASDAIAGGAAVKSMFSFKLCQACTLLTHLLNRLLSKPILLEGAL